MLPFGEGVAVYLASVESAVTELRAISTEALTCVVEQEGGRENFVLYSPDGRRLPIMAVADVPATLGGERFNISNAACDLRGLANGIALDAIRAHCATTPLTKTICLTSSANCPSPSSWTMRTTPMHALAGETIWLPMS
jgi:hypothetical protein